MGVGSSSPEIPGGGTEGYHVLRVSIVNKEKRTLSSVVGATVKFRPFRPLRHVSLFWFGIGTFI